jgi:SAM-dependent methyltransferase
VTNNIHPSAAGFEVGAVEYEAGRPPYSAAAVEWLLDHLGTGPQSSILDLAAGTGKLTRELVPRVGRVVAVEPIAAMRAVFRSQLPAVELLDGTAERIPLGADAVDAVTVAQAFHWFNLDVALPEIHRVLVPKGRLGLIWNKRDLTQPVQAELSAIIEPYRGSTPTHETNAWRRDLDSSELFGPIASHQFPLEHEIEAEGLVARAISVSFIARLDNAERQRVIERVSELASRYGSRISLRYLAHTYSSEAR